MNLYATNAMFGYKIFNFLFIHALWKIPRLRENITAVMITSEHNWQKAL